MNQTKTAVTMADYRVVFVPLNLPFQQNEQVLLHFCTSSVLFTSSRLGFFSSVERGVSTATSPSTGLAFELQRFQSPWTETLFPFPPTVFRRFLVKHSGVNVI